MTIFSSSWAHVFAHQVGLVVSVQDSHVIFGGQCDGHMRKSWPTHDAAGTASLSPVKVVGLSYGQAHTIAQHRVAARAVHVDVMSDGRRHVGSLIKTTSERITSPYPRPPSFKKLHCSRCTPLLSRHPDALQPLRQNRHTMRADDGTHRHGHRRPNVHDVPFRNGFRSGPRRAHGGAAPCVTIVTIDNSRWL